MISMQMTTRIRSDTDGTDDNDDMDMNTVAVRRTELSVNSIPKVQL